MTRFNHIRRQTWIREGWANRTAFIRVPELSLFSAGYMRAPRTTLLVAFEATLADKRTLYPPCANADGQGWVKLTCLSVLAAFYFCII